MRITQKILILLIFSLLKTSLVYSQDHKAFVGFRFGPVLPLGQFASHNFDDGGYALLGKSYGCEAAWFFNRNLGAGFDISYKSFGFASGFYRDDYVESEPSYKEMDLLSGPYKVQTYMAGLYYHIELTSKLSSTFKIMGGIYKARTPDQFYGVIDNLFERENYFWKTGASSTRFSFLTGAAFSYTLFEHVEITLQADFTTANSVFKYDKGDEIYERNMKMPVFQLSPGINITF